MSKHPNFNSSFEELWYKLETKYNDIHNKNIYENFKNEPDRVKNFSTELDDLYIDFSKNKCDQETLNLLLSLADAANIKSAIKNLFAGEIVNQSENRPALHTALRGTATSYESGGSVVSKTIDDEVQRINQFIQKLHTEKITGHSGKSIDTLINIGIGGSDLGPKLAVDALYRYRNKNIEVYFVSNVDAGDIQLILEKANPETTMFCISSKTFSTIETLTNAESAKRWLLSNSCTDIGKHFIAVTANKPEAGKFGIQSDKCFQIWEWVGGRYSLWSAIGLPVVASIGIDNFKEMLAGANKMDEHFISTPLEKNIPVILAMLDIWYINFYKTSSLAIIPYDQSLKLMPEYLSQLFMESNGKQVTQSGQKLEYLTSPVIWGGVGTNAQHTFFQLLHQGTHLVPADFIVTLKKENNYKEHQDILLANCIAQTRALMLGSKDNDKTLSPYKMVTGNKPSTTIVCNELTPFTLGMLLAMYEHRVFVQGYIWNINSFDQWGVELGKKLANTIYQDIKDENTDLTYDNSTNELIRRYKNSGD